MIRSNDMISMKLILLMKHRRKFLRMEPPENLRGFFPLDKLPMYIIGAGFFVNHSENPRNQCIQFMFFRLWIQKNECRESAYKTIAIDTRWWTKISSTSPGVDVQNTDSVEMENTV